MTDTDTAPDWRDPAAYAYINDLGADARRWEFLRRSGEYQDAFASGQLSNPTIARMNFGLGKAPDPSTRGDELDDSFRFASKGELARIGASRPAKPLPLSGPTVADFRIDLTRSIGEQVEAIRAEAERLAAALTAEWSAQEEEASKARRRAAGPFAQLATQVTAQGNVWEESEDGAPVLNPRKPKEGQASVRLLQVLDALDAGASQEQIAEALFGGHRPNTSTAIKDARAAARAAARSWP